MKIAQRKENGWTPNVMHRPAFADYDHESDDSTDEYTFGPGMLGVLAEKNALISDEQVILFSLLYTRARARTQTVSQERGFYSAMPKLGNPPAPARPQVYLRVYPNPVLVQHV
jgi:hypothetical protein